LIDSDKTLNTADI